MESSCIAFHGINGENLQVERGNTTTNNNNISPFGKRRPSSRRTHSFSCSSSFGSSSSSFDDSSPLSPNTPLRFSGIPFSWEQHPGIPKKYLINNSVSPASSSKTIPLPPPNPIPSKRFNLESILPTRKKKQSEVNNNFHSDPFVAALMECSKDLTKDGVDDEDYWKMEENNKGASRTLSNRLVGFVDLHASCKNTTSCAVSNSTVFIPKSSNRARYHLLNHHRRG
ncbi:TBC1 domain family member 5 homolog B-like [Telopea speciosissima]|uniref:TBC1 domain family member 5 homolog B-like n=1 Tax=Telopea speciosissima TaxID=54955 RepID=UPI001CC6FC32|nr:TBC1 domain family member 5 homolog B-like [Telopea speciosissima]